MTPPPARRNDPDRRQIREDEARRQAEIRKEAERRAAEAEKKKGRKR